MYELGMKEIKMTSRELAEITGKRHADVMRDIRNEADQIEKEAQRIFALGSYKDSNNQERPQYTFGRDGAMQLALKYDALTRRKVILKISELEKQQVPTGTDLIALALIEAHKVLEEREEQIQLMKPKAEYFDALVDRNLLINIRDTAKELKTGQNKFIKWLIDNKYVYRDGGKTIKPYSRFTPELFELKEFEKHGHAGTQTLITPKGRETFRLLYR